LMQLMEFSKPVYTGMTDFETCPFCRSPNHGKEHMEYPFNYTNRNAEAGKAWAQSELGNCMVHGVWDVAIDHWNAKRHWLELAAENGDILAMRLIHELWAVSFRKAEVCRPRIMTNRWNTCSSGSQGPWNRSVQVRQDTTNKFLVDNKHVDDTFGSSRIRVGTTRPSREPILVV
jgi:hypothetical protein